ncbi:MAG TPA: type VI secretion system baseplate subunit TssF [Acetobacteraceae bacterium]|nr:type VI secretion system baseplate subunit TssF [Acetobacteraceae bacterium]
MSDSLLPYYNRELVAIRRLAAEFAETHPKIAGRLRLAADAVDDPHVARLLEGAAFLAARVHHRLDDEFPELTDSLLGVLYPHYLAPLPSCAIAQFSVQPDLLTPFRADPGLAIETEPVRGEVCRFRTAAPVTAWPVQIESVRLSGLPLAAPPNPTAGGAVAVLRIVLKCAVAETTFAQLGIEQLRFFLRGAPNVSMPLFELLSAHTLSVAYAESPVDPQPVIVPGGGIQPAGFAADEALLPWPARSFSGFRLLSEYFAFPEKFLFLDFLRMEGKTLVSGGNRLEIFVYLDRAVPELERAVDADALALGCAPIVNLFSQRCEPIPLTHTDTEYRVVPDARRPGAMEVWGVERVREARPDGSSRPWRPFYRLTHGDPEAGVPGGFFHVTRRDSPLALGGSELFLAPHDPDFDPEKPLDGVLSVDALCLNRDLPADLPFGGGHPRLRLVEGAAGVAKLSCLTSPTPTLRMKLREGGFWRLVSHLSLSHLSVVGGAEGAQALKEVLRLYDRRDTAETRAAIDALTGVSAAPGAARVPGARAGAFCRGLDVKLEFDPRSWQAGGLYLLASVLERFLALHGSVNSFVRTTAVLRGRAGREAAFPPRAGARVLL